VSDYNLAAIDLSVVTSVVFLMNFDELRTSQEIDTTIRGVLTM
jgi:hypothetical protein